MLQMLQVPGFPVRNRSAPRSPKIPRGYIPTSEGYLRIGSRPHQKAAELEGRE